MKVLLFSSFFVTSFTNFTRANRDSRVACVLFETSVVCLNVVCSQELPFVLLLFSHYWNQNWVVLAQEILLQ